MINFRNTNIFFATLLIILAGLFLSWGISLSILIVVPVIYSVVLFWGCYNVRSNFFIPIICAADTSKMQIAISFDDGPEPTLTPAILRVLKDNNVQAAFFCIGNRIKGNEELLVQIHKEHHIIGNHSYTHHFWFDLYSASKMHADLRLMDEQVKKVTGLTPHLFRPPYGVTNPTVKKAIIKGKYIPVGWSVRSMDTVMKDETKLLNKLNTSLKPGAVFLFHDTSKITLSVLPRFIEYAKQKGYEIIRLDKMLNLHPYV